MVYNIRLKMRVGALILALNIWYKKSWMCKVKFNVADIIDIKNLNNYHGWQHKIENEWCTCGCWFKHQF